MKEQRTQEAGNRCCYCMEKHTLRSQEQKKALINRLRRIEGQVRGVQQMLESLLKVLNDAEGIDLTPLKKAVEEA